MTDLCRVSLVGAWAFGLCVAAGAAHAQVFSPGVLSRAHAELEGIAACTRCHGEGSRHDNTRCLECHKEIATRLARDEGYHRTVKAKLCAECHREHRGIDAELIVWSPSKRLFNHTLAGWPLEGSHKKAECKSCHDARRLHDDSIRALATKTRRATFLGLDPTCARCHFDEHRGQEGDRCQSCHTPESFERAPGFNHNDSADAAFPLTGKHKKVQCEKCHQTLTDETARTDAFPAPRANTYLQFKDVPHASCVACHDDPHRGQFGKACSRCHTTDGWMSIKQGAEDTGFHDKTDFPLRGEHTSVACKTCHGPFAGQAAVFKGLKHGQCADCHIDAHVGQTADAQGAVACEKCHDVRGFVPVLFDRLQHDSTRYALDGAHETVACNLCHKSDARLLRKVSQAVRRDVDRKGRRLLVSDALLDLPEVFNAPVGGAPRCERCHADPHAGQFSARMEKTGCNGCHATASFTAVTFSHDDSRFPLRGRHAEVACSGCHQPQTAGQGSRKSATVVIYRPLEVACSSCHSDVHLGQLAKAGTTDCARCHAPTGFKPAAFDHNTQSSFPLEGRHREVQCQQCHPSVVVEGIATTRYRPLPVTCAGCHDDEHRGRFDPYAPQGRP